MYNLFLGWGVWEESGREKPPKKIDGILILNLWW
jgi:hypothetical protein